MRTSQFATIQVIVAPEEHTIGTSSNGLLKTVGFAQSISIDDNFGSRAQSTIGTPLPVLAPGFQLTNVRLQKATIDGSDFRNLGSMNPLAAHVGKTYVNEGLIDIGQAMSLVDSGSVADNPEMFSFMFVLAIRNRVSNSYTKTNITHDNRPANGTSGARTSPFGIYACVLQSATISAQSQQAVIMEDVSAIARPISGTWLNDKIKQAFSSQGDARNGMRDVMYSVLYGYRS